MDKITVITQTTAEREAEMLDLYKKCLPLLKEGKTLSQAVKIVKNYNHNKFARRAWYRELLRYAKSKGYEGY